MLTECQEVFCKSTLVSGTFCGNGNVLYLHCKKVATSYVWLLSPWNVTVWGTKFYLILINLGLNNHTWLAATVFAVQSSKFFKCMNPFSIHDNAKTLVESWMGRSSFWEVAQDFTACTRQSWDLKVKSLGNLVPRHLLHVILKNWSPTGQGPSWHVCVLVAGKLRKCISGSCPSEVITHKVGNCPNRGKVQKILDQYGCSASVYDFLPDLLILQTVQQENASY